MPYTYKAYGPIGATVNGHPVAFRLMERESDCSFQSSDGCLNSARFQVYVPEHPEYPAAMVCAHHVQRIRNNSNTENTN